MTVSPTRVASTEDQQLKLQSSQFRLFRDLIYKRTGISLADNKLEFVQNRLSKRLRANNMDSFAGYFRMLMDNPEGKEMQEMINRITTNKTHFFRENHHFEYLRDVVFRRVIEQASQGKRKKQLRIWCAASSTGEEPYSLAAMVCDSFAHLPGWDAKILATDIDTSVLRKAQEAVFHMSQALEVPEETMRKHFSKVKDDTEELIRVRPQTTKYVTFRQLNLLGSDWGLRGKFDAIFIRNVLIYFDQPTQDQLMRRLASYLALDGSLFIGHSESLSSLNDVYTRVGKTVYQHASSVNATAAKLRPNAITNRRASESKASKQSRQGPAASKSVIKKKKVKRIVVGDVFASHRPATVSTVLGSCVAVCLFDPVSKIGGMNHFALPTGASMARTAASFGVHAMELLINKLMQLGADRDVLQAKVFGGADVMKAGNGEEGIGQRNSKFIHDFLSTEGLPVVAEYMGGERGMQVLFETASGRAKLKLLDREGALQADRYLREVTKAVPQEPVSDITLF